jgi:hypothetical protein
MKIKELIWEEREPSRFCEYIACSEHPLGEFSILKHKKSNIGFCLEIEWGGDTDYFGGIGVYSTPEEAKKAAHKYIEDLVMGCLED